ncbi:hypothetical protein EO93_18060 [Methanosarcina sp. 1.H.A.2.2]|nr:hypothetical protein EO93_18060 [Methanosarcina sp. 1.H.A.2.2]
MIPELFLNSYVIKYPRQLAGGVSSPIKKEGHEKEWSNFQGILFYFNFVLFVFLPTVFFVAFNFYLSFHFILYFFTLKDQTDVRR